MTAPSASFLATRRGKLLLLLLVYALVRAPEQGWGGARAISELVTAAVIALRPPTAAARPPRPAAPCRPGQVPAPELADWPSSAATPRRPAANRQPESSGQGEIT